MDSTSSDFIESDLDYNNAKFLNIELDHIEKITVSQNSNQSSLVSKLNQSFDDTSVSFSITNSGTTVSQQTSSELSNHLTNEYLQTQAERRELTKLYDRFKDHSKLIHSQKALQRALAFYVKHKRSIQCPNIKALNIQNKDYIIVGDYTLPHSVNQRPLDRLFILNLKKDSIVSSPMAHGYGSNSNCPREYRVSCGHRGTKCMIPSTLGNRSGSGATSRGFYLTQEPYRSGRNAFRGGSPRSRGANALRLEGLYYGVNHNARSRAIVFHRASYYRNACSSSAGCPAINPSIFENYKKILKGTKDKGGVLMYLHTLEDEQRAQPDC